MAYGGWKMDENGTLRWCVTVRQALSGGYADIMRIDDSDSSLAPDPSPGRWFCVELYWHRDVSQGPPSNGEVLSAGAELYVDGIMACSSSNLTYSNPVSTVQFGLAETYGVGPATIYIDSCAIDACRLGIIDYVPPEPSNLSITGRIYYSTYPLDGVRVELFEGNSQSLPLQSVLTIDGFYSFSGVAPGSYDITAYGPTSEFLTYATYYDTVISSNVTKDFYLSKIITVHSPLNQANITSLHPTISWETNKEASRYNIQINVLDGTQLGEIVENGICTSTSYTVINELTPGLRYWLHIGAADALSHEVGSNLWTTFTVVRPERDLSISILTPGNTFTSTTIVNTTIQNLGLSNESDIVVQFFVNGSLATSKTITFLENASSTVLSARASPAAFEGKVYVGSADNSVYCLNGLTGAKVWSYATNGYASCSPAIAGGRVYIGSDDRNSARLDTYTGTKIWSYTTGDRVSSSAVAGGVLYLGSFDGSVYAFGGSAHLIPTTLTCSISSSQVSKEGTITVSGIITPAVSGQFITLRYAGPSGFVYTSWSTCHSDGSYSHSYNPNTAGLWSVTVSWVGNTTHSSSSTSKSFTVKDTAVDFSAFPTTYIIAGAGAVTALAVTVYVLTKRREEPSIAPSLKLARPSGVTVLVVLEILVGLVLLGGGAIFASLSWWIDQSPFYPSEFNIPVAAMSWGIYMVQVLAGIFVVADLVSFIEVFGLWRGSRWAWILGLILAGLGIILGITSFPTGIVYIAIQAVVIYYLTRPHVRQFFNRGAPAPPSPSPPPPPTPTPPESTST